MTVSGELSTRLADRTAHQLDDIIRAAILKFTGSDDIVLADVKRLGVVKTLPGGNQIFAYDGVDLVEIGPLKVERREGDGGSIKVVFNRPYRLLLKSI